MGEVTLYSPPASSQSVIRSYQLSVLADLGFSPITDGGKIERAFVCSCDETSDNLQAARYREQGQNRSRPMGNTSRATFRFAAISPLC